MEESFIGELRSTFASCATLKPNDATIYWIISYYPAMWVKSV